MRFSVYGLFELDVERREGRWVAFRRGEGLRRPEPDIHIPRDLTEDEVGPYLEDLLHEAARPGTALRRIH